MRTLSRPMFNWGGPVKAGIMHGIREPYKGGGAALVGDPRFPKDQTGRAHHYTWIPAVYGTARAGLAAIPKLAPRASKAFQKVKGLFGRDIPQNVGTTTVGGKAVQTVGTGSVWTPKGWVARDPIYRVGRQVVENRGLLGKPIAWTAKQIATPTGVGLTGWGAYSYLKGDKKPDGSDAVTGVMKPGGYPKGTGTGTGTEKGLSSAERDAFALAERNKRVQKYLDMMGYDRSKKTALADALIDASKIVSDRGTLDRKNITAELINPAIQALSRRLDKPEQIREAVGLMATKAEIEKDLSKEKDALATRLTMTKIRQGEKALESGIAGKLLTYMAAKKGRVKGDDLVDFVRLSANEEGKNFTMVTDEQVQAVPGWENKSAEDVISFIAQDDGVYMMGDTVIEVEGGKPTRIK